jgi:hypothetical protein
MSVSISIVAATITVTSLVSPECGYFPGAYFDSQARTTLQRRAMEKWPGPSQLVRRWQAGELNHREKMAVLLGASVSHDVVLLPLYREAIESDNDRLRMAAAYGYRELLGELSPNVTGGVNRALAQALATEMDVVAQTLRERPLVEFWLQAALAAEGKTMPGWRGVVFQRPAGVSLRAVERVVSFDDLRFLTVAYRLAETQSSRLALLRLLEAVTLQRFVKMPQGVRAGWGQKHVNEALEAADAFVEYWVDVRCVLDPRLVLSASMAELGVWGVQPLGPDAFDFWLQVLKRGQPEWRMMAARRLYEFGGPWADLSVFRAESNDQTALWEGLVAWYGTPVPNQGGQTDPSSVPGH